MAKEIVFCIFFADDCHICVYIKRLLSLVYAIGAGVVEPNKPGHSFGAGDMMDIATGVVGSILGFFSVAFGEIIGVFFAIEENTRRTAELLRSEKK